MSSYPKLLDELQEEEQYINNIAKSEDKVEQASFEYISPKTGLKIKHHIPVLNSIENQDVWSWCTIIKETARMCNWDEEALAEALTQIVSLNIQHRLGQVHSSEEFFTKLCQLKYNPATSIKYFEQLSRIKPDDFITIKAYHRKIEELSQKLGLCSNWSQEIVNLKIEETFCNGLNENVKLEMLKSKRTNAEEIYQSIYLVEDILIQKLTTTISAKTQDACIRAYNFSHPANKESKKYPEEKQRRKFCKYHKSKTHNTNECITLTKTRKKNYTKREDTPRKDAEHSHNYGITSQCTDEKVLEIPIKINDIQLDAMIDTGADKNYISTDVVSKLQIETEEMEAPLPAECANGDLITITHTAKIRFKCAADKTIDYLGMFHILPRKKNTIILGMSFLKQNLAVIDLKNNILVLDGREYELEGFCNKESVLEDQILSNTKIFNISESKKKIDNLIKAAKLNNPEIGKIEVTNHEIQLKNGRAKIKTTKNYSVPVCLQKDLLKHLNDLEKHGIIKKANPSFCAPAFVTRKKNGKLRLLIDYRELNKATVKRGHPIPSISTYLLDLKGSCYFSNIDLNKGYYQIPMKESDIEKTGFTLMNRSYVFLRMPFGLTNAPRTFQYAMTKIFSDLEYVKIYLDDILVHSKSLEDHFLHLKNVFQRIKSFGMSVNFEKSNFGLEEIKYLGFVINKYGVKANTTAISDLKLRTPKTRKQLEKLIGFFNWFRPFVFNLSLKLAPLYDKLKKAKQKFTLTAQDEDKINEIISEIKMQQVLSHPNLNQSFNLKCDASDIGVGATLTQGNNIVGIFSKKFSKSEYNYTVYEKEAFAILLALQHFKPLIYNSKIIIFTDNKNNIYNGDLNKRMTRWKMLMEEFDYELNYIKGDKNFEADLLSRNLSVNTITTKKASLTAQKTHEKQLNTIYNTLLTLHEKLGHPGHYTLSKTLSNYINTKKYNKLIKEICSNCIKCNQEKIFTNKYCHTNWTTEIPEIRETLCIDIKGPIKTSHYNTTVKNSYFHILLMTDWFSRYTEIKIIYDATSATITTALKQKWFSLYGTPSRILTDNGRQFISTTFENFINDNKIQHIFSGAYNPSGNSIVERRNLEVGLILRLLRGSTFKQLEDAIWNRLNLCYNRILTKTPFEVFFKASIFKDKQPINDIKVEHIKSMIRNNLNKNLNYENKKRIFKRYSIGEKLFIKNFSPDKVEKKWLGPFEVTGYSKSENNVVIKKFNKYIKIPVKITRPFRGGENAGRLLYIAAHMFHKNDENDINLKLIKNDESFKKEKIIKNWKFREMEGN
ncbi:Retrovirus-related Pol polyprotein from transposon 17.6 [Dictyocoela muelleri]|nr:Retrovirus-related Pol polyprotein from transposon 17.6 [Dictyocoela muelleri]